MICAAILNLKARNFNIGWNTHTSNWSTINVGNLINQHYRSPLNMLKTSVYKQPPEMGKARSRLILEPLEVQSQSSPSQFSSIIFSWSLHERTKRERNWDQV